MPIEPKAAALQLGSIPNLVETACPISQSHWLTLHFVRDDAFIANPPSGSLHELSELGGAFVSYRQNQ